MLLQRSVIVLGAALVLNFCLNSVSAADKGKPAEIQAYADGSIVNVLVDTNVSPEDEVIASGIANPIYVISTELQAINHALSIPTGKPSDDTYNPYWILIPIIFSDTADVTFPLTSEDAVLAAVDAGYATLDYAHAVYVLCPEISAP